MREEDESNIRGGETDMDLYRKNPTIEQMAEMFCEEYERYGRNLISIGVITKLLTTATEQARRDNKELIDALKRIIVISDRKHDAWDEAKAIIARIEGVLK